MTPFNSINHQIDQKRKEITELEKVARQSMKLYSMIQDLVDLAETRKTDMKSCRDISLRQYLNDFCTVSISTPRMSGKTSALMQWELKNKNCLFWMLQGSSDRDITKYPLVKGNSGITEQFERMFRGTEKQVDYLLIDEYHFCNPDALTTLQGAILAQNLAANKKDPSFITIKVGTPL